jgi:hypothetical protein
VTCGGRSRVDVWRDLGLRGPVVKSVISVREGDGRGGGVVFGYKGCFMDPPPPSAKGVTSKRLLAGYSFTSSTGMTQEGCVNTCAEKGFAVAGVEYGRECYCADGLGVADGGDVGRVGDEQCNMLCSGDGGEYCGAGNRIGVWELGLNGR